MSRFGKSSSKKRRDNRGGPGKNGHRNASPQVGNDSKKTGPVHDDKRNGSARDESVKRGHGEGHGHRRKHSVDPRRSHFRPFTPRSGPKDYGDRKQPEVGQQSIEKSRTLIRSWLDAGAELREKNLSTSRQKPDPRTLTLDPWQQQVFDLLRSGESVVVDAPTTAGKTRAVEVFFAMNIDDPTFRAAYTTPVKSLSNDKVRELRAMFGDEKVGIATGDIKENLDAPIVVATLESYRNSLLGIDPHLG